MIIVTGGAGFIGSNIVHGLNSRGFSDVLVVDDLSDGKKFFNIRDAKIRDFIDKDDFLKLIQQQRALGRIEAIFHQGACSDTTEWDGKRMFRDNFSFSKEVFRWAISKKLPFYYASSAAVYGRECKFQDSSSAAVPLNVYGYSKRLFDDFYRAEMRRVKSPVAGLRYFNVYGPREGHKGKMASVILHFLQQLRTGDSMKLFEGSDGFGPGEQRRDFIYVDDVVRVNLWLLDNPRVCGIFNCGTGESRSFNDVARILISLIGRGVIEYVSFPESLRQSYQSFTEADLSSLRKAGYADSFVQLEAGIKKYLAWSDIQVRS
ncbi:MAG: ADP-glyceromanno-heptose 6-epimerase [Gammaproteobacteria bacterium]|nr:ADP-glyceromanno-heptose 6-epimerase [Gammaproteobacteria bacterium]